jgi:hypothetical protein
MKCFWCKSERILTIVGKTDDRFSVNFMNGHMQHDGYVLSGIGIGGGDYVDLSLCMECGQVQGEFPVTDEKIADSIRAQF